VPPTVEPTVYITFDDGPHPTATTFIMQQLEQYDAHATFFCLGKNALLYPEVYKQLIEKGHRVANHTHNHLNGWKTDDNTYVENIKTAAQYINSDLFRPPYGLIKRSQVRRIKQTYPSWKICMWNVLSADFDTTITPEKCLENVLKNIKPGSIVLFHDSDKAWPRMSYALPKVLEYCKKNNWQIKTLP
jgi:peptidoglycan/xylan/chitin deacetylase (PgdA/CDA1 family)